MFLCIFWHEIASTIIPWVSIFVIIDGLCKFENLSCLALGPFCVTRNLELGPIKLY